MSVADLGSSVNHARLWYRRVYKICFFFLISLFGDCSPGDSAFLSAPMIVNTNF